MLWQKFSTQRYAMLTLPSEYITLIQVFAPIFSKRIWKHIHVLIVGAILTPGKRTVTSVLRIMGLSHARGASTFKIIIGS